MTDRVELQLTFKSQDDRDIKEYIQQLAEDTTVVAIVGPTTSACAEQMAVALGKRKTYCEGLPGTLFITAANPYETSHADVWSDEVCVYLSNGFTRGFQEAIAQNPAISLRDLYYTLAAHTTGSHVKVYNAPHFGSVYSNTMAEFLR